MIYLNKIELYDIKKFSLKHVFDFSSEEKIFTLSGKNGCGKTTVIESLMLCQMAYFFKKYDKNLSENQISKCNKQILNYLTNKKSYIKIVFSCDFNEDGTNEINFKIFKTKEFWNIDISEDDSKIFDKYWNLDDPKGLFFFINSDKYYEEESISYDNMKIQKEDKKRSLLESIVDYNNVTKHIYSRLVNDYILSRLNPSGQQTAHKIAKVLFHSLLPSIQIDNFTGSNEGEFKSQAKHETGGKFDFRYLSSGEKTVFYSCLILNYFPNLGLLIIDEPENHLHEDLLLKFVDLLYRITECKNYPELIFNLQKDMDEDEDSELSDDKTEKRTKGFESNVKKYFSSFNLHKVLFTTHNKALIYKTFYLGSNFLINDKLEFLKQNDAERKLHELGITSGYEKLLFVEGDDDKNRLEIILKGLPIEICVLNNCETVLSVYQSIEKIKQNIHSIDFCFLMDRDTRELNFFADLMHADSDFYNKHFIPTWGHEFENYYLDKKLIEGIFLKNSSAVTDLTVPESEIESWLEEAAEKTKTTVFRKDLNEKLDFNLKCFNQLIKMDEINVSLTDENVFGDYAQRIEDNIKTKNIKDEFIQTYKQIIEKYKKWNTEKLKLCDGKEALNTIMPKLKLNSNQINDAIRLLVAEDVDEEYQFTKLVKQIKKKLKLV